VSEVRGDLSREAGHSTALAEGRVCMALVCTEDGPPAVDDNPAWH